MDNLTRLIQQNIRKNGGTKTQNRCFDAKSPNLISPFHQWHIPVNCEYECSHSLSSLGMHLYSVQSFFSSSNVIIWKVGALWRIPANYLRFLLSLNGTEFSKVQMINRKWNVMHNHVLIIVLELLRTSCYISSTNVKESTFFNGSCRFFEWCCRITIDSAETFTGK